MNDPSPTQTGTRVLIVEDDPHFREAMAAFLDDRGFSVRVAGTAREALDIAGRFKPAVLLSDWNLGGDRTGVDVARALQADNRVRVIFISGNPLHRLRRAAADLEVVRFLRKPISLDRLTCLIEGDDPCKSPA